MPQKVLLQHTNQCMLNQKRLKLNSIMRRLKCYTHLVGSMLYPGRYYPRDRLTIMAKQGFQRSDSLMDYLWYSDINNDATAPAPAAATYVHEESRWNGNSC